MLEKLMKEDGNGKKRGRGKKPEPMKSKSKPVKRETQTGQTGQQPARQQPAHHPPQVSFLPSGIANY